MRMHLFEFEDQKWFPDVIKAGGTDYLRYLLKYAEPYKPVIPLLEASLEKTGQNRIIDLCSGGGGYIEQVCDAVNQKYSVVLTDKFPNYHAFRLLEKKTNGRISFVNRPVDATSVPEDLEGFRVMFSAIHHFKPEDVEAILLDAVGRNAPIGIFDGADLNILSVLGILILHPVAFLLFTPFFKPFKFSRFVFTYVVPLIPLYTIWDGCVSVLRIYRASELYEIAASLHTNYTWQYGKTRNRFGMRATYLIGLPAQPIQEAVK